MHSVLVAPQIRPTRGSLRHDVGCHVYSGASDVTPACNLNTLASIAISWFELIARTEAQVQAAIRASQVVQHMATGTTQPSSTFTTRETHIQHEGNVNSRGAFWSLKFTLQQSNHKYIPLFLHSTYPPLHFHFFFTLFFSIDPN